MSADLAGRWLGRRLPVPECAAISGAREREGRDSDGEDALEFRLGPLVSGAAAAAAATMDRADRLIAFAAAARAACDTVFPFANIRKYVFLE